MKKAVVHFEIGCDDIPETAHFYKQVFDWEIDIAGNSVSIDSGREDAIPRHLNKLGANEPQKYINLYIETDEIDLNLKQIEAKGVKKLIDPIQLPDGRSFA